MPNGPICRLYQILEDLYHSQAKLSHEIFTSTKFYLCSWLGCTPPDIFFTGVHPGENLHPGWGSEEGCTEGKGYKISQGLNSHRPGILHKINKELASFLKI